MGWVSPMLNWTIEPFQENENGAVGVMVAMLGKSAATWDGGTS